MSSKFSAKPLQLHPHAMHALSRCEVITGDVRLGMSKRKLHFPEEAGKMVCV